MGFVQLCIGNAHGVQGMPRGCTPGDAARGGEAAGGVRGHGGELAREADDGEDCRDGVPGIHHVAHAVAPFDTAHEERLPDGAREDARCEHRGKDARRAIHTVGLDGGDDEHDADAVARKARGAAAREQEKEAEKVHADAGQAEEEARVEPPARVREARLGPGDAERKRRRKARGAECPREVDAEARAGIERRGTLA